jgi:predicted porin
MMKKKLMVVAVGAALAAPALSYAAVEISGRGNVGIGTWSATGATNSLNDKASRMRVWDSGSYILLKANEDLGGGLKVETYIETGINIDTGTANGQSGNTATTGGAGAVPGGQPLSNAGSSGFFGSRQAWVGLSGNFGKVTIGKQNTFYGSGDQDLTQAVYLDTGIQFATAVLAVSPNVNRLSNSIRYTTPMLGPVEVLLTYATPGEDAVNSSTNNQPTSATGNNGNANTTSAKVTAVTVQGAQGQLSGGFDYVSNDTGLSSAAQGKTTGMKLRVGFKYQPGAQISLVYITDKQTLSTGENKQSAYQINWEHQMGNIGLHAGYGRAGDISSTAGATTADTNTSAIQFGVRFIHSKTTWTYFNYVSYTNANNANLSPVAGGMNSQATSLGADPKVMSLGIQHRF